MSKINFCPTAEFYFRIDFVLQVNKPESKSLPSGNGLAYTVLYLELRVEPAHMSNNGNLILRCTSVVATLYKHTAELSLGPRTSEPVPERGNYYLTYIYVLHTPRTYIGRQPVNMRRYSYLHALTVGMQIGSGDSAVEYRAEPSIVRIP
ncbi:unnamed protein product [Nesidiocoris tenuis]|uniref:Uncharacterized protein n=1 Tax=Nesidiocoris tenuis TaxID=355587 RepID=A0A6H5GSB8_9HEMI|nr:unnamed protein product [Nesidiocoris tenuis]